jgi:hypothetical protein
MAHKITTVSADPAFQKFNNWFLEKLAEFESAGDTASITQFNNAQTAKTEANTAANASIVEQEDGSVIQTNNVIVPEFEVVYNQWIAQYNVQFTNEEV